MPRHLLVTGTGRAGTTLLVQLFDALGLDTGMERLEYYPEAHAGYEARPDQPLAYVLKWPLLQLDQAAAAGWDLGAIEAAVVPIRDLRQAALSRKVRSASTSSHWVPGGMASTQNPFRQEAELARRLHRFLEVAADREIPVHFVGYPRFATDVEYAFRQLGRFTPDRGHDEFVAAWTQVVDPSLVRTEPLADSVGRDLRLTLKWGLLSARRRAGRLLRRPSSGDAG